MHAILVHGWRGWPDNAWFPWLRRSLEEKGWTVEIPAMPHPMVPERVAWVSLLEQTVQQAIERRIPANKIVLVGHSLGCVAILQLLMRHEGTPFAKVVLVSGFARNFGAFGLKPWLDPPVNFDIVKVTAREWHVLHGNADVVVPVAEGQWLAEQLNVPLMFTAWPGHFMHEEGVKELPEVLEAIL